MKKLADNLYSAKGHGEKYRILTEKVRAASELMQKTAQRRAQQKNRGQEQPQEERQGPHMA